MTASKRDHQRYRAALLAGMTALLPVSPAFAQDAAAPAAAETADDDNMIIVTAQRRSENIQDVPISVQAITGDSLAEKGVLQVQDLQKVAPNVTITSPLGQGSAPAISIRGIGLNDFNTNNSGPNGVYIDEFAVSSPNAQGLSFFDLERIEVLKGPQGTLYGRNASGGAINITTNKPTFDFSAMGRLSYSSYNSVEADAAVGGPLGETLAARVAAMYRYSDGFMYNHLYDRRENGVNMWGLRGQLLWQPSSDFSALLKAQVVRNVTRSTMYKNFGALDPVTHDLCSVEDTLSNNCVDLTGYAGRKGLYEGDWNNGDKKVRLTDYNTTLRMQYDLANGFNIVSITGYNDNERFHPEQTDANPFRTLEIDFGARSKEFTQELRLAGDIGPAEFVVGAFFINERIRQNQPLFVLLDGDTIFGAPGALDGVAFKADTRNNQRTRSEALFGQVDFAATDQLTITAGARYTWENRRFHTFSSSFYQSGGMDNFGPEQDIAEFDLRLKDHNFSWKLGTNFEVSPDFMLFASASTGYKAGGFNGGFLSQDPVERAGQLEPFKAETVLAYEAGFKSQFADRRVTLNASAFYNRYKNQQVSILRLIENPNSPLNNQILFALANAERARIYGVDADLSVRVTPELTLSGQLGVIDAKFTRFVTATADLSGNRLSLAPKVTAAVAADYERDIGPAVLKLGYSGSYRSKYFFEPTNDPYLFQNGYWLHNARVALSFNDDRFEVAAFARNFAKKKYLIWNAALFDPFGVATATVGEPRFLGVEAKFKY